MAASRGRTVGSLIWRCGSCCNNGNIVSSSLSSQVKVFGRQVSLSAAVHRKNLAAAGPEKFSEEFIKKQVEEFNIGKRHLANMMGEDVENFTQEDIDRSIAYLFPSSLFEKKARPLMKHPDEIFPRQRAVQWGADRRPFHFLFYTGKQSYYNLMHDTFARVLAAEKQQDRLRARSLLPEPSKKSSLGGSRWLFKEELEELLVETISDYDYQRFLQLVMRLQERGSSAEEDFLLSLRRRLEVQSSRQEVPALQVDEQGHSYSTAEGRRKSATGSVVLTDGGSGDVIINGSRCHHYFTVLQDREQLMFPLVFTGVLGRFDMRCSVAGGGHSSQAGALRLALSRALLSFLSQGQVENMRQAGLLTPDPRVRERKKPGQEGARRKFTWNKR
ncbi:28S ribosomal protein S9, mitochondrial isoform X1 [Hypomesus transpacificus]|uniref:28S ribosomal protein S9, mitochondrial isoform X1 n=1 Tax=Hypomesus transpacificus TaxID=137520 RepID=UPI001F0771E0|nr:28S ribosomal protein S9, mitochondrial isoform X1 [Hypomesus transpacificus]